MDRSSNKWNSILLEERNSLLRSKKTTQLCQEYQGVPPERRISAYVRDIFFPWYQYRLRWNNPYIQYAIFFLRIIWYSKITGARDWININLANKKNVYLFTKNEWFILYFTPMPLPSGNPIDLRCLATPCVMFFTPETRDTHMR